MLEDNDTGQEAELQNRAVPNVSQVGGAAGLIGPAHQLAQAGELGIPLGADLELGLFLARDCALGLDA